MEEEKVQVAETEKIIVKSWFKGYAIYDSWSDGTLTCRMWFLDADGRSYLSNFETIGKAPA